MSGVTLLATRGIPGSGKTTFARAWVAESPEDRARCNRDDLRANLFGRPRLSFPEEQVVSKVQHASVEALLRSGRSVVVDDTHLHAKHLRAWHTLARSVGAEFAVHDVAVPVDECVRRDAARAERGDRAVGEDVIRRMADKAQVRPNGSLLPLPDFDADAARKAAEGAAGVPAAYADPGEDFPRAWLFDIDGTLANMTGRGPYDWPRVGEDEPVEAVVRATWAHFKAGDKVILMSGRDGSCRQETLDWLVRHGVTFDELHMRAADDNRKDSIVKAELFDRHVRGKFRVQAVYDDRDQVVEMWRAMGLPCFQVAPGAF